MQFWYLLKFKVNTYLKYKGTKEQEENQNLKMKSITVNGLV